MKKEEGEGDILGVLKPLRDVLVATDKRRRC